ncbi:MAG: DUF2460 domain-containing protein [Rhodothermales bacterium]|nr:DUF2460 domain-containing protein [Rhodothermales bacterium]
MAFIETPRFSERALLGATFGPSWSTDVQVYGNGTELRNANWQYPLLRAELPFTDDIDTIEDILQQFHAAQGRLNGFRVKDPSDYKSCDLASSVAATDQLLGTGDGTTVEFQLRKRYTFGSTIIYRNITKPVSGSVVVNVIEAGSPSTGYDPGDWSVDTTTGVITFGSPPPASGTEIYAGFEFDVPMRFDIDFLPLQFISPEVIQISNIPLVELRA